MTTNKVLGIILARKGSKRLPGKNKEKLGSMSLVDVLMKKAKDAGIQTVAICTDYAYFPINQVDGCDIINVYRPPQLSGDDVPSEEVISYVLSYIREQTQNFNYFCLMQLTAPLFHSKTLKHAIEDTVEHGIIGCASITPSYKPSGNFYISRMDEFMQSGKKDLWPEGMMMVKVGWDECVDIDEIYDLRIAQAAFSHDVFTEG